MAIGSMMRTFAVELADVDRGRYESLAFRAAQHPSETERYLLTRVLAYCLEYEEGIAFGGGVSTAEEPAVLVRDATGRITNWIEVGAPDAARLHFASKLADRTAVYTHRDPAKLVEAWSGQGIHRAEDLVVRSFEPGFVDGAAAALERRNALVLSVTEGQLYLEIAGQHFSSELREHRIFA